MARYTQADSTSALVNLAKNITDIMIDSWWVLSYGGSWAGAGCNIQGAAGAFCTRFTLTLDLDLKSA